MLWMGKDVTFAAESYKPAREDHLALPKLYECIGLLSRIDIPSRGSGSGPRKIVQHMSQGCADFR